MGLFNFKTKKFSNVKQTYWKAKKVPIFKQRNDDRRLGGNLARPMPNMANPAAVYAKNQGLPYEILKDPKGNQYGMVTLPSGQKVEEWAYYRQMNPPKQPTIPSGPKVYPIPIPKGPTQPISRNPIPKGPTQPIPHNPIPKSPSTQFPRKQLPITPGTEYPRKQLPITPGTQYPRKQLKR